MKGELLSLKAKSACLALALLCMGSLLAPAQSLDGFVFRDNPDISANMTVTDFRFNGYTNYWHDIYRDWINYGNFFKMIVPNPELSILQGKVDVAEDMGIPGLLMQEGFFSSLEASNYTSLREPTPGQLEEALGHGNVLISVDPASEVGKAVTKDLPPYHEMMKERVKSHQYFAKDFVPVSAFVLENGDRKLFVISSSDPECRKKLTDIIRSTADILDRYDLHKGWFGAKTLKKSVTITPGHYLEVMGKGMEEGIDWFVFDGYMDFLAQDELREWVRRVDLPVVADVGSSPIYGLDNYDGLQVQGNYTREDYVKFAHDRGGYAFKPAADTSVMGNNLPYDGFITYGGGGGGGTATAGYDGNKMHIDNEDVPFINPTNDLRSGPVLSMVVFTGKGEALTHESLWEAIMDRREVAVLEQGLMMGPAAYRHALDLLFLDRVWPEEYFGDRIRLRTFVEDYTLRVVLTNTYPHTVSGTLEMTLPEELKVDGETSLTVQLPAGGEKQFTFRLKPQAGAMNDANPISLCYKWEGNEKRALAMLELPRFISAHQLLYGLAPTVTYPVTIHNFSEESSFPVRVEVSRKDNPGRVVYRTSSECTAPTGKFQDLSFDLKLPAGAYNVKVSALGLENISQLGVGASGKGKATLSEVDLNDDGVNEYRMENDSVRVTLLTTGARVIEYIVKSRNDNVFFKLWPEKALDDRRAYRYRGYYPFGGFEDFLGQGSMETHKVYDAEIVKAEGDYVQVKMVADYFGNRLEKIFTLYGNSPLVEVRFALTFINPEANVLGPQPIIELGEKHFTEDKFYTPTQDGLVEWVMDPLRTYGRVLYMKEGWNAGYDTEEDVSFVGAYPVAEPLYLHMWMNLRRNRDANYDYLEFQPWTPIYQKSTMYFSYYMWGAGGSWENGVQALRDRNLISVMP